MKELEHFILNFMYENTIIKIEHDDLFSIIILSFMDTIGIRKLVLHNVSEFNIKNLEEHIGCKAEFYITNWNVLVNNNYIELYLGDWPKQLTFKFTNYSFR